MRRGKCGGEIQGGSETGVRSGERPCASWTARRVLLGLFSSGWVVTAAISEFWHALYITRIHGVDFSQQTKVFFQTLERDYLWPSELWFMGSCLWLTLVLFVWAWKLAVHLERSKALAEALLTRPPASDV